MVPEVEAVQILLISGSPRAGSTNTAMLRTARAIAPDGIIATLFTGMTDLPYFSPDDDGRHPAVVALRAAIEASQALLLCTPEYAGALPGSFKNLLDWSVGGGEMYRKPVAWINVSSLPTGALEAHASLARVLSYLGADIVTAACAHIPVTRTAIGEDGLIASPTLRDQVGGVLTLLHSHVTRIT